MKVNNPNKFSYPLILNSKSHYDLWKNNLIRDNPNIDDMGSEEFLFFPNINNYPTIVTPKYNSLDKLSGFNEERDYYGWKIKNILIKLHPNTQKEIYKELQKYEGK